MTLQRRISKPYSPGRHVQLDNAQSREGNGTNASR